MKKKEKQPEKEPFFPGTIVEDETLERLGIEVTVYPVGFRHIKQFSNSILGAFQLLASNLSLKGKTADELGTEAMTKILPYALNNLMDLVEKTVIVRPSEVEFGELPHFAIPPILEAWIEENMGDEDKWGPWVKAINRVVTKFSKKQFSILEMLSSYSSPQDTPDTTSSNIDSEDSPIEVGA